MNTPLYNELISYSKKNTPFHMPGHKFGVGANLKSIDLLALDNTEAVGMDNLYVADGIIKQAMELMANFYGSKQSIFLTNGSTSGIIASILCLCKEGDQIIISRNAHHSVWSALTLAGAIPIYITPIYNQEHKLIEQIDAETINRTIELYPNVKGALIVSPTYEGIVSDIEQIANILHNKDKILIVDEAHGAHFELSNDFPVSSVKLGADIVINSTHKTLPALTQSALLHICSHRVSYQDIISRLRMIQTSSPSYMMMGVMDYVREYIVQNRELIQNSYINELIKFRSKLIRELKILRLLDKPKLKYDYSKIIIFTSQASINGYELASILHSKYNITVEAELEDYIIIMTTMSDDKLTLEYLCSSILEIDSQVHLSKSNSDKKEHIDSVHVLGTEIIKGISPRIIYNGNNKWIPIEESSGQISAENIMLYPPGIPLVCIGEKISNHHISIVNKYKDIIQGVSIKDGNILLYVGEGYTV